MQGSFLKEPVSCGVTWFMWGYRSSALCIIGYQTTYECTIEIEGYSAADVGLFKIMDN